MTILAILAVLLLQSAVANADTSPSCVQLPNLGCAAGDTWTGIHDYGGATSIEIPNTVVGSLPAAGTVGRVAVVTDGSSASDCTVGSGSNYNICIDNGSTWVIAGDGTGAGGTMTSFDVAGDSGSVTITDGNTLSLLGDADAGDDGIDIVCAATDTCTFTFDATEIDSDTFGSGSGFTWTFDAGATDPTIAFGSGTITLSDMTCTNCVDGSEIAMGSDATGDILYYTAGADYARLPIGASNEVLRVASGLPDWEDLGNLIGAGDLANALTWAEVCTESGGTCTLANAPRVSAGCSADGSGGSILAFSNGIQMKCVASTPGINEFTLSSTTFTFGNTANSPALVYYER